MLNIIVTYNYADDQINFITLFLSYYHLTYTTAILVIIKPTLFYFSPDFSAIYRMNFIAFYAYYFFGDSYFLQYPAEILIKKIIFPNGDIIMLHCMPA